MKNISAFRHDSNTICISKIKGELEIVEIVRSAGVELNKAGFGLCPFHDEKTPSFKVYSEKGRFKCFSCGESGDVLDFLQKVRGCSFKDVLKDLAGGPVRFSAPDPAEARRRLLIYFFREWERWYSEILCQWVGAVNRLLFKACLGPDDLPRFAEIIRLKAVCENHLGCLAYGDDEKKHALFQSIRAGGCDYVC